MLNVDAVVVCVSTIVCIYSLFPIITYFIAAVWFINGFFCKVLGLVPRHRQIVAEILGKKNSSSLTILIGLAEIAMAGWVLAGIFPGWTAALQILLIMLMNVLEYFKARRLLLWGGYNLIFALLFSGLIAFNAYFIPQ